MYYLGVTTKNIQRGVVSPVMPSSENLLRKAARAAKKSKAMDQQTILVDWERTSSGFI
jgi:hypothetical protein